MNFHEWQHSIYGDIDDLDMPIPLGKIVQTSSFFDTNPYHDLVSGPTITHIFHLVYQTPIEWY